MLAVPLELFAVWARVGWMARVAALVSPLSASFATTSVVAFVTVPPMVNWQVLLWLRWAEESLSDWMAEAHLV